MMQAFAALFIFNPFEIYIWCASSIYGVLVYRATRPIAYIAGLRFRENSCVIGKKGAIGV